MCSRTWRYHSLPTKGFYKLLYFARILLLCNFLVSPFAAATAAAAAAATVTVTVTVTVTSPSCILLDVIPSKTYRSSLSNQKEILGKIGGGGGGERKLELKI